MFQLCAEIYIRQTFVTYTLFWLLLGYFILHLVIPTKAGNYFRRLQSHTLQLYTTLGDNSMNLGRR